MDAAAAELAVQLNWLVDYIEEQERLAGESQRGKTRQTLRLPCARSGLDFLTYQGNAIGPKAQRKDFKAQLMMCKLCSIRSQCLEWALAEPVQIGIWGGLMPSERMEML